MPWSEKQEVLKEDYIQIRKVLESNRRSSMMFNHFWGMDFCCWVVFRELARENDALKRNLVWAILLVKSKLDDFLFKEVCNKDAYEKQWVKDEKRWD